MNIKYIAIILAFASGSLVHGMQQMQRVAAHVASIDIFDEMQATKKRKLEVGAEALYDDYDQETAPEKRIFYRCKLCRP